MSTPHSRPEVHTFRPRFGPLFLAMAVYTQMLFAPVFWLLTYFTAVHFSLNSPTINDLIGYVTTSLAVTLVLLPATWLLWYTLPCKVSADGLACPNAFGKMISVKWGDISEVRAFHFPGLPYLVVRTRVTRWRLWVPLFLSRLEEFTGLVGRHAGPDHVLYQALWPRVEQR